MFICAEIDQIFAQIALEKGDIMSIFNKVKNALDKIGLFSKGVNIISLIAVFVMTIITTIDVVFRYFLHNSIVGIYEFTAAIMILVVYLGIAYAQEQKAHVVVDLFTARLKPQGKVISDFSNTLLCLLIAVIMIWCSITQTHYYAVNHSSTNHSFFLPAAPFAFVMVAGCILFALMFLRDLCQNIADGIKQKLTLLQWILGMVIPAGIIIISLLFINSELNFSTTVLGVICIVVSLVLMFMGLPISMAFILASLIFISMINDPSAALSLLSTELFSTPTNYSWTVIPFFLFLGYIVFYADFGNDLYTAAYRIVGRLPGGLAVATITACAGFAAVVGNGTAPCVTMGAVSLPEMKKYKYQDTLATGSIIGGCSLGPIIPPSQPLIIYGLLASLSVGKLFMASLIPGILLWIAFSVYIILKCKIKPEAGPKGKEVYTLKEKLQALAKAIPILVLFVIIIGGIYIGVFSATEAGAIGCVVAMVIALFMKRLSWERLKNAMIETGKATAMILLILIGAQMISRVIALARLPYLLSALIENMNVSPYMAVIVILLIFFALGFVIDMMPLILIGVPVVHPAMVALGFDPIWFAIMLSIVIGLGTITPPVGINLFTLKGVSRDTPIGTIYKGAIPFVFVTILVLAMCFVVPKLITWLPGILYR